MTLRVIDPGLYSLVVDCGRPNWRHKGVSLGGAADRTSLALGNALVGNPVDFPALEICLHGPTLTTDDPIACVVYGAPFDVSINGRSVAAGTTFTLQPDDEVVIGGTSVGMRAYLCVRGGLQVPSILGSHSATTPLQGGESIPCNPSQLNRRFYAQKLVEALQTITPDKTIRFVDGPQADWFPPGAFEQAESFTVQNESDRMGLRLRGPGFDYGSRELVSEPVCPGSVQVTPNGQCIILGVDGQTIGGYPKIANVISADLDKLGQLRPGDSVRFGRVEREEAVGLFRAKQEAIDVCAVRGRESVGVVV